MRTHDETYMQQCLALAELALAAGDPPVGAIIVLNGEVIGQGIESARSSGDVTEHAEIQAVRDSVAKGYADQLSLSAMYTTHEPCIMCSYAIRHYRIPKIIYGASVPHIGGATSKFDILVTRDVPKWHKQPEIIGGVCVAECNELSERFARSLNRS